MVLAAGQSSQGRSRSLAELCERYWFPLYVYLRRQGYARHDAEDLLQSFFYWLITQGVIKRADRQRGRFRTFLRVALRQFCVRESRRARAQKRRPPAGLLSLDFSAAESRYDQALADHWTPERQFDHSWTLTTLEVATARLREEYRQAGRLERFERLAPLLSGGPSLDRDAHAAQLGLNTAAFNVALSRMRRQFGKILREEVARTVAADDDVEDELRQMMAALSPN